MLYVILSFLKIFEIMGIEFNMIKWLEIKKVRVWACLVPYCDFAMNHGYIILVDQELGYSWSSMI